MPRHPPDALKRLILQLSIETRPLVQGQNPSTKRSRPCDAEEPFTCTLHQPGPKTARKPPPNQADCNLFTMPKTKAENQNAPKERQKLPAKTKPKPSRKLTNPPDHPNSGRQNLMARTWWRWTGSNRRPPACKAGALPTELHPLLLSRTKPCRYPRRTHAKARALTQKRHTGGPRRT